MNDFGSKIYAAAQKAVKEVYDLDVAEGQLVVETPQDTKLGDYSTSIAMKLSRTLRRNPMEIAEPLVAKLAELLPECESITVARPGFINFKLKASVLTAVINDVITAGDDYGKNDSGKGKHLLLEWVSANPTGDLHCGHARNAAWGDCIARMMEASGWDVLREFYVNDAGNQIVMLGESLTARYFEHFGKEYPPARGRLPRRRHQGASPRSSLRKRATSGSPPIRRSASRTSWTTARRRSSKRSTAISRPTASRCRAGCMRRSSMRTTPSASTTACSTWRIWVSPTKKDGALWFKSTDYGDDKDRVLRKSDGTFSYLTPDIANHVYKIERGYPLLVNLWGADHHSYVTRMQNALTALGYPEGTLSVDLIQMVRMVEDGKEVKMSKRTGNAITIRELCEDIGVDAARWFFVSKDVATHMDLDLKLARSKDNNNPVYYAQYAYSRMCSILKNPQIPEFKPVDSYDRLTDEKELQLLKMISEFPKEVAADALNRKPNKMTEYIISLVKVFHSYYNSTKVNNPDDPELTNQRLGLIKATMITLKNALQLIGVSAPETM